jgi:formate hydrogenlyase transcriptional activator
MIERCGWRINGEGNAAAVLGLEPSTLRSRMHELGIRRPARAQVPRR